jgi:hypothetical protein
VIHPGTDKDRPNGKNKDTMEVAVEAVVDVLGNEEIRA